MKADGLHGLRRSHRRMARSWAVRGARPSRPGAGCCPFGRWTTVDDPTSDVRTTATSRSASRQGHGAGRSLVPRRARRACELPGHGCIPASRRSRCHHLGADPVLATGGEIGPPTAGRSDGGLAHPGAMVELRRCVATIRGDPAAAHLLPRTGRLRVRRDRRRYVGSDARSGGPRYAEPLMARRGALEPRREGPTPHATTTLLTRHDGRWVAAVVPGPPRACPRQSGALRPTSTPSRPTADFWAGFVRVRRR